MKMKQIYSDLVQYRGSHYDYGVMQGKLLKESLIIQNWTKQWRIKNPRITIEKNEVETVIKSFAPGIWEELVGLQDALKWPMNEILRYFGGYHLDYIKSGCSIFTGTDYMIRNYDYHPKTYEGRYMLFQPTDRGYATIGPSQNITGRMDGMNEKGLSIGYNFIHHKKPQKGFISNMIARIILENCVNVSEALSMLKEMPHRHSFNYVILDESEETFIVEASPRGIEIRQSNICTNHFDILTDENRHHLEDSMNRFEAIHREEDKIQHVSDAFRLLNDDDKGIFSKNYRSSAGTIHTAAYLPRQRQAWFAIGGNQKPFKIKFRNWLHGENIATKRMHGEIDTDIPFLHIDKI